MDTQGPNGDAGRESFILGELLRSGEVKVDDLSRRLAVNSSTIRRDLEKLERQRLIKRVHGGAVPVDTLTRGSFSHDLVFQANMSQNTEEKTNIALAAARLIRSGDTIMLSTGTTVAHLARAIRHLNIGGLTVVTNAVNIAIELAGLRDIDLLVSGGTVLPDFFAMVGPMAEQSLRQVYVKKAFIGVAGLSLTHGMTQPNAMQALAHRIIIEQAEQVIVLADSSKIGKVALYHTAPITAMHTFITGADAPAEAVSTLRSMGIEVVQA